MISDHVKTAAGQRDIKSVVGIQLYCAFPARRPRFGKSGDGRAILATSRILLSQNTSSALVAAIAATRGFFALPPVGDSTLSLVNPGSLTSISDGFMPIRSSTRITRASSTESI